MPAARHYTSQDNGLLQPWGGAGISQPAVRARCRSVVFEVTPRAIRRSDQGSDCIVEVSDGDSRVEEIDGVIV